jgi:hypothetical protein
MFKYNRWDATAGFPMMIFFFCVLSRESKNIAFLGLCILRIVALELLHFFIDFLDELGLFIEEKPICTKKKFPSLCRLPSAPKSLAPYFYSFRST